MARRPTDRLAKAAEQCGFAAPVCCAEGRARQLGPNEIAAHDRFAAGRIPTDRGGMPVTASGLKR